MSQFSLAAATLVSDGKPILGKLKDGISLLADAHGVGVFLSVEAPMVSNNLDTGPAVSVLASDSRLAWNLGEPAGLERMLACSRTEPYWMTPWIGTAARSMPKETQFLLICRQDGLHVLIVPLLDAPLRFVLEGSAEGLMLVGETNDAFTPGSGGVGAFIAVGADPYALIPRAAEAVAARLPGCVLSRHKPLPDFVDLFGWCTWDAFYQDVAPEGIRRGLASFAGIGIRPRLLIIDDGWLSVARQPAGGVRLTALQPNAKFAGTLAPTVRHAKDNGVTCVLAWHAFLGNWGGIDGQRLPGYQVRQVPRSHGVGMLHVRHEANQQWWGALVGVPSGEGIAAFYDDWHRLLAQQGVDGVKVDVQAAAEACATGVGGRVGLIRALRDGLEGSVERHFAGRLINCMAHNSETWYCSPRSNLTRFSGDFYPTRPETHGPHLWSNAAVGLWFGEFLHGDWDMFHSLHPQAGFHAAGRAVSGSPVYVSDKPGVHDAELLRRLVFSDGTVARCVEVGRPTPDCLYADPVRETVLFKVFNRNRHGAVVGAFNLHRDGAALAGTVSAGDVPGLPAGGQVFYAHRDGRLSCSGLDLTLDPLGWEVVTIAPVVNDMAVIGLAGMLNSGGALISLAWQDGTCQVALRDGGRLVAWAKGRPRRVRIGEADADFSFDPATGLLVIDLPVGGPHGCAITP